MLEDLVGVLLKKLEWSVETGWAYYDDEGELVSMPNHIAEAIEDITAVLDYDIEDDDDYE